MKIEGFKRSNFTTKDGAPIHGLNLYVSYPATGEEAEGLICERLYMTDAKLAMCGYTPKVGDEVTVSYNKFGKPASIFPVKR